MRLPRTVYVLTSAGLTAAALLTTPLAALAAWDTGSGGASAGARAARLPSGPTPSAVSLGSVVSVDWSAVDLAAGVPVRGYRVTRTNALTGSAVTAGGHCAGVVTGTGCTETAVPDGNWTYSVVAVMGENWVSAPGFAPAVEVSTTPVPAPVVVTPPAAPTVTPSPADPTVTPSPADPTMTPTSAPTGPVDPSESPAASPTPTKTPDPAETPDPAQSTEPAKSPAPTKSPAPSKSLAPTKSPAPTRSPAPSETPKPSKSVEPSQSPKPTKSVESPKPTKSEEPKSKSDDDAQPKADATQSGAADSTQS